MKVIVKADHPIFKTIGKVFSDPHLASEYAGKLNHAGYENVRVEPLYLNIGEQIVEKSS